MFVHAHVCIFEVIVVDCFIRRASELRKKPHLSLAEKSKDLKKVGTAGLTWYSTYIRT